MEDTEESISRDYPNLIPYECHKKINEQMEKKICKIIAENTQGTGFFCKIPFPNKEHMLPVLITNNHIINDNFLRKENAKIKIDIKEEIELKEINLNNRLYFTDEFYDITIIGINKKDNINNYLELDDIIMNDILNNINKNKEYIYQTIYIIQYPENSLSVSYGILQGICEDKKYNIIHKCNTREGSSGSPILNINNKVIGIHKGGKKKVDCNRGTLINYPIKDFIVKNKNKINNLNIGNYKIIDPKIENEFFDVNSINNQNIVKNIQTVEKSIENTKPINQIKYYNLNNINNNPSFNYFIQNNNNLHLNELNEPNYGTFSVQENNILKTNNNNYFSYEEIRSNNNVNEYYKESQGGLFKNYAYVKGPNSQEDNIIAIENFKNDKNKIIFGFFDGHGGGQVSKFLQEKFIPSFNINEKIPIENNFNIIQNSFKALDEKIKLLNVPNVGSSATIVYISRIYNKKYLYCINVGDSRCIIKNKKEIMVLSEDHTVDNSKEMERIIEEGGIIYNNNIYGISKLSRSFGDWSIKQFGIKCKPHICRIEINEKDLYLVIASGAVWNTVDIKNSQLLNNLNMSSMDICKNIINQSLMSGAYSNISCLVIKFK